MTDIVAHLTRQAAFSKATFGPGPRTKGVIEHVRKELEEVEKCYAPRVNTVVTGSYINQETMDRVPTTRDIPIKVSPEEQHRDATYEWVDVAILGLDGLLRSISAANPDWTFDRVGQHAWHLIHAKQAKNEMRDWPDWRTASSDRAIEHVRGTHD